MKLPRLVIGAAFAAVLGHAGAALGQGAVAVATPAAPTAAETAAPPAAAPQAVPADAVVDEVRRLLAEAAFTAPHAADDIAAARAFYDERASAVWTTAKGLTPAAAAAVKEIRRADDWGLEASQFEVSEPAAGDSAPLALATAEAKLTLAILKYARHARGGRVDPGALSRIIDYRPTLKDPKAVLAEISANEAPDAYLRALHPRHVQFERLRQALLEARGPAIEAPVDEALKVKLPEGGNIKPGAEHADVALLRQRLKVPAPLGANALYYDAALVDAVKAFQKDKGIKVSGIVTGKVRALLNGEAEAKRPNKERDVQRLLINMERWRWMPEDLGPLYVWDNVPEYMARVMKDGREVFFERIIVGLTDWPTPTFSADMQFIHFHPSWGVPDGIKQKELLPRLRKYSGGGFFDFFSGGGGASVLRAYGLTAYRNGRPVDADSVNWGNVDIRNYSFTQPPGVSNPLGIVKFRFPNRHDVYMHDTTQRDLFKPSRRTFSHGCMRVQNPMRLAEILLGEDKGWSAETVKAQLAAGSQEVALSRPIPVHVTYFTAMADEAGTVSTFGDIYGHDSRLAAALTGRPMRFEAPPAPEEEFVASAEDAPLATTGKKQKRRKGDQVQDLFTNPLSGLVAN